MPKFKVGTTEYELETSADKPRLKVSNSEFGIMYLSLTTDSEQSQSRPRVKITAPDETVYYIKDTYTFPEGVEGEYRFIINYGVIKVKPYQVTDNSGYAEDLYCYYTKDGFEAGLGGTTSGNLIDGRDIEDTPLSYTNLSVDTTVARFYTDSDPSISSKRHPLDNREFVNVIDMDFTYPTAESTYCHHVVFGYSPSIENDTDELITMPKQPSRIVFERKMNNDTYEVLHDTGYITNPSLINTTFYFGDGYEGGGYGEYFKGFRITAYHNWMVHDIGWENLSIVTPKLGNLLQHYCDADKTWLYYNPLSSTFWNICSLELLQDIAPSEKVVLFYLPEGREAQAYNSFMTNYVRVGHGAYSMALIEVGNSDGTELGTVFLTNTYSDTSFLAENGNSISFSYYNVLGDYSS